MIIQASLKPFHFSIGAGAAPVSGGLPLGVSDISRYDSLAPREYNPKLTGLQAQQIYHQMRRYDQVQTVELALAVCVGAAEWRLEPGGAGAADKEAANFITGCLRPRTQPGLPREQTAEDMETPLSEIIRVMALSAMLGFTLLVEEYEERDGYVRWRKFHDRPSDTIQQFVYEDGRLARVLQSGLDEQLHYHALIPIEMSHSVLTTFRPDGGNRAGFGLCRAMYWGWYSVMNLARCMLIGAEKYLVGTPIMKMPFGASDDDQKNMVALLEELRVNEKTALAYKEGYEPGILEAKRDLMECLPMLKHFETKMVRAALAQFINLGDTDSGSYSLSMTHLKLFIRYLEYLADVIADAFSRQAIPHLCRQNFPGLKVFPRLEHAQMSTLLNLEATGELLKALVDGGLITPDGDIENNIRALLGWAALKPDDARDRAGAQPTNPAPNAPDPNATDDGNHSPEPAVARSRTASEGGRGRGAGVRTSLEPHASLDDACACSAHFADDPMVQAAATAFRQADDELQAQATSLVTDLIASLGKQAAPLLKKSSGASPLGRAGNLRRVLAAAQAPRAAHYATVWKQYLTALLQSGRQAMADAGGQPVMGLSRADKSFISAQGDHLAEKHLADVRWAYIQQVMDGVIAGVPDAQVVSDAASLAARKSNAVFAQIWQDVIAQAAEHTA